MRTSDCAGREERAEQGEEKGAERKKRLGTQECVQRGAGQCQRFNGKKGIHAKGVLAKVGSTQEGIFARGLSAKVAAKSEGWSHGLAKAQA
eukprot:2527391-Pleurochrysis_carterae.AAC.1